VLTHDAPDRKQDALALVVACTVLVRFTEIADLDRTIDGADDLGKPDLGRRASQDVAAADATLGAHEACPFQREQDLFQVRLREPVRSAMSRTDVGPDSPTCNESDSNALAA
jgi:hypothetical protein